MKNLQGTWERSLAGEGEFEQTKIIQVDKPYLWKNSLPSSPFHDLCPPCHGPSPARCPGWTRGRYFSPGQALTRVVKKEDRKWCKMMYAGEKMNKRMRARGWQEETRGRRRWRQAACTLQIWSNGVNVIQAVARAPPLTCGETQNPQRNKGNQNTIPSYGHDHSGLGVGTEDVFECSAERTVVMSCGWRWR